MTWFDMVSTERDWNGIAKVLDGLANAGFNGVRLPMFPENDGWVRGNKPGGEGKVGWKECNQYVLFVSTFSICKRAVT